MDHPAEQLNDDEITLRRWCASDAPTVHRIVNESLEHLAPWMAWAVGSYTDQDAVKFVGACQKNWETGESFDYAIVVRDWGVVGSCGLMNRIGPTGLEIGYWLHHHYTGNGIVTRSAWLLMLEAFRIGAERVEIVHDIANQRSKGIPERLGFGEVETRPAELPGGYASSGQVRVWRRYRE